jgi:hypothetical protein
MFLILKADHKNFSISNFCKNYRYLFQNDLFILTKRSKIFIYLGSYLCLLRHTVILFSRSSPLVLVLQMEISVSFNIESRLKDSVHEITENKRTVFFHRYHFYCYSNLEHLLILRVNLTKSSRYFL